MRGFGGFHSSSSGDDEPDADVEAIRRELARQQALEARARDGSRASAAGTEAGGVRELAQTVSSLSLDDDGTASTASSRAASPPGTPRLQSGSPLLRTTTGARRGRLSAGEDDLPRPNFDVEAAMEAAMAAAELRGESHGRSHNHSAAVDVDPSEVERLRAENAKLRERAHRKKAEARELRARVKELEGEAARGQAMGAELRKQLGALKAAQARGAQEAQARARECEAQAAALAAHEARAEQLEEEHALELAELQEARAAAEDEAGALRERVARLEEQRARADEQAAQLRQRAARLDARRAELTEQVAERDVRLAALADELEAVRAELARAKAAAEPKHKHPRTPREDEEGHGDAP